MAIYYSRLSTVCRSKGHSVVAAAAYRAGIRLTDERTEQAHDFSKRRGVLSTTMLARGNVPWAVDIEKAWSLAERAEVRRNARTGRELIVALPAELSDHETGVLAHELGQDLVDVYGVAVLVAVHAADAHGDERNRHVHLLMSTRVVEEGGFGAKVRVLDDRTTGPLEAQAMRTRVADRINGALARAGRAMRVDARTLNEQASAAATRGDFDAVVALSRAPMRHQGRVATAMARRGEASPVVAANLQRASENVVAHGWGSQRAGQMRRALQARTARGAPAPRTSRHQELRKGLGAVGSMSRATGRDAELLNAQTRAQEEGVRAARDGVEAYLDAMSRVADQQAIALRAVGEEIRRGIENADALVASQQAAHVHALALRNAAEDEHALHRKAAAKAQHETARARGFEVDAEAAMPPVWQVMSRRKWADHRRRQRAETQRREHAEREAALIVRGSAKNLEKASQLFNAAEQLLQETRENAKKARCAAPAETATRARNSALHVDDAEEPLISRSPQRSRRRKWH